MQIIYKYTLKIQDIQEIIMPVGAVILSAQMQNNEIVLWAGVDLSSNIEVIQFRIFGTGQPMPKINMQYIATVQTHKERLVWHIFKCSTLLNT